jgi:type IV pilus assembly protein PilA
MMIVVAIIGILAAIAIPSYQSNVSIARSHACLSESKSYSNNVLYTLNDQDDNTIPIAPTLGACQSITDATGWTLQTQQKIIAIAKSPSNARIECDVPNGSPCRVLP